MVKVILWDIDGTLLDFKQSEYDAVKKCFEIFHMGNCTDEMIERYSNINAKYWERLERGEITKEQTLIGRFEEFFASEGLSVQKAQAFNKEYQIRLGDKVFFNDDANALILELKSKVKQYAVTNGTLAAQSSKLAKSGLDTLLDGTFISDEIGVEKPNIEFFNHVFGEIKKAGTSQEHLRNDEIMIVGDSLTSDMQGGNNAGILCCWYNPKGTKNTRDLKIDYEIRNLKEVIALIEEDRLQAVYEKIDSQSL